MKFKLIKTSPLAVVIETELTENHFARTNNDTKVLKENNKPVFKIDWNGNMNAISNCGIVLGASKVFVPLDNCTEEDARFLIAEISQYANKVEKQILDEYNNLERLAKEVVVE